MASLLSEFFRLAFKMYVSVKVQPNESFNESRLR